MVLAIGQPYYLFEGDNRDLMANMGDNTVDAIVTDPPYELTSIVKRFEAADAKPAKPGSDGSFRRLSGGFMGMRWDSTGIPFDPDFWAECLRVLKPGGHLLAFSGTRTYHRMAYAIDLAGFEIRDMLSWLYGSGFPKSHDVALALDKMAGAERGRIERPAFGGTFSDDNGTTYGTAIDKAPISPEAVEWQGWGTALKPACEPICMARKPLDGSVASNVLQWDVGAINVDGCRIAGEGWKRPGSNAVGGVYGDYKNDTARENTAGRFPANVLHDGSPEVLAGFPAQAGAAAPVRGVEASAAIADVYNARARVPGAFHGDSGSAARFFYCAKASKADREIGCEHLAKGPAGMVSENSGQHMTRRDEGYKVAERANIHPTVKPTDLMRWLVRLVAPPGALVFDPFTGSGSTGRGAIFEGCRFIGAEMTAEYIPIARARIDAAVKGK